jgi:hypothetical protein
VGPEKPNDNNGGFAPSKSRKTMSENPSQHNSYTEQNWRGRRTQTHEMNCKVFAAIRGISGARTEVLVAYFHVTRATIARLASCLDTDWPHYQKVAREFRSWGEIDFMHRYLTLEDIDNIEWHRARLAQARRDRIKKLRETRARNKREK